MHIVPKEPREWFAYSFVIAVVYLGEKWVDSTIRSLLHSLSH